MRPLDEDFHRTKPTLARVIGPVGCIASYHSLREAGVQPLPGIRRTGEWAARFRPAEVVSNLRPGLPCWLAWQAVQQEWPLVAVVCKLQLEKAPSDLRELLHLLWHGASERVLVPTVDERDSYVTERAPLVSIRNILDLTVPILDHPVVSSESEEVTKW